MMRPLTDARVLIVDDEESVVRLLEGVLREAGFEHITGITDPEQATGAFSDAVPDVMLLDMEMPGANGLAVMESLSQWVRGSRGTPVILMIDDADAETRQRALTRGAREFLGKPIDRSEVLPRIRNVLEARRLQEMLRERVSMDDSTLRARAEELELGQLEALERLALAAEYRDDNSHAHHSRVGRTAAGIAAQMGLDQHIVERIRQAAPLHDIGKIAIPEELLLRPGRLSDEEMAVIKTHVVAGAQMLSSPKSSLLQMAEEIVLSHHERWDGMGYPHGLAGEEIPLSGRIVAVADVFDALSHERPYRPAWTPEEALAEIRSLSGLAFDPAVVRAFEALDPATLIDAPPAPAAGTAVA